MEEEMRRESRSGEKHLLDRSECRESFRVVAPDPEQRREARQTQALVTKGRKQRTQRWKGDETGIGDRVR